MAAPLPVPAFPQGKDKKAQKKIEEKEHRNLIPSVKKSSATVLKFQSGILVSSQHKRKLRCLELCPANDQLVITRWSQKDLIVASAGDDKKISLCLRKGHNVGHLPTSSIDRGDDIEEWERPKSERRPDIFSKFSPMKTPSPHPLPADDPLDDDKEEEEEEQPTPEEPQEDDPDKEEPEEDDPDKPTE